MLRQKFANAAFLVLATTSLSADSAQMAGENAADDNSVFCTDVLSRAMDFNRGGQFAEILKPALDRAIDGGLRKYGSTDAFTAALLHSMVETTSEESEASKAINTYSQHHRKFDFNVRQCLFAYSQ